MGISTTHLLAFLVGSALMAIVRKMPELFLNLTLTELGQKMDIWKKRSKTSGTDTNLNKVYVSQISDPRDWLSTALPTQTASSNSSNLQWTGWMTAQEPYGQGIQSLIKCSKAASKAPAFSPSLREQERERLTGLLGSLEHCVKLVKEYLSFQQKHPIQNFGLDISLPYKTLIGFENTLCM